MEQTLNGKKRHATAMLKGACLVLDTLNFNKLTEENHETANNLLDQIAAAVLILDAVYNTLKERHP